MKSLLEIVHPAKLAELAGLAGGRDAVGELPDWERETPVTGCVTASNGLKYFVWKLRHRTEQDRFARGKRYDLTSFRRKTRTGFATTWYGMRKSATSWLGIRDYPVT